MKQELTDIHQHPIWGMDDGADSRETMFSMLREAHFQGIKTIVATTHAAPGFHPFNMELYTERLAEAQAFCNLEDLQIRLLPTMGNLIRQTGYKTPDAVPNGKVQQYE